MPAESTCCGSTQGVNRKRNIYANIGLANMKMRNRMIDQVIQHQYMQEKSESYLERVMVNKLIDIQYLVVTESIEAIIGSVIKITGGFLMLVHAIPSRVFPC
jgi:hypothetical protein